MKKSASRKKDAALPSESTALDRTIVRLKTDIVTGKLAPDSKLRLDDLKVRYGVSGSPLREALSRLAGAGFVLAEPQRGFCVPGASREDLLDITMIRQLIETKALAMSMENGDEVWEGELVAAFHRFKQRTERGYHLETETLSQWEEAHKDFHMALISACGSDRLIELQEDLYDQALRYRRMLVEYRFSAVDLVAEHTDLMNAILSGDKALAIEELTRHLSLTADLVNSFINKDTEVRL